MLGNGRVTVGGGHFEEAFRVPVGRGTGRPNRGPRRPRPDARRCRRTGRAAPARPWRATGSGTGPAACGCVRGANRAGRLEARPLSRRPRCAAHDRARSRWPGPDAQMPRGPRTRARPRSVQWTGGCDANARPAVNYRETPERRWTGAGSRSRVWHSIGGRRRARRRSYLYRRSKAREGNIAGPLCGTAPAGVWFPRRPASPDAVDPPNPTPPCATEHPGPRRG